MALLSLPALFCFISGTAFKNDELKSVEQFTFTTLGSLGEQATSCQDTGLETNITNGVGEYAKATLELGCPSEDYKMTTVNVFVGDPTGSCGCQPWAKPDSKGSCMPQYELEQVNGVTESKLFETYLGKEPLYRQPCCGIGNPPVFSTEP